MFLEDGYVLLQAIWAAPVRWAALLMGNPLTPRWPMYEMPVDRYLCCQQVPNRSMESKIESVPDRTLAAYEFSFASRDQFNFKRVALRRTF
jgi:hypothetical protein